MFPFHPGRFLPQAAIFAPAGGGGAAPVITADATVVFPPNGNSNPINIAAGNLVVLIICGYNLASAVTASSTHLGAFTSQGELNSGGQVLTAVNSGGALTGEVITLNVSQNAWHVWSISGANASPLDGSPVFIAATGSSQPLAVSLTTTGTNRLLLANAVGGIVADSAPWSAAPAGQTAYGEIDESRTAATAATYTAFTGQSQNGSSMIVAIKP